MSNTINLYGDKRNATASGHGVDIASQRMDDLDQASLEGIKTLVETFRQCPLVFDLGCGIGAHSVRMAEVGATVMAFDINDNEEAISKLAAENGVLSRVTFARLDIRKGLAPIQKKPSVVYSQRTLHYLKFDEAVSVLSMLVERAGPEMSFFISVSGLDSELGMGYAHANLPVEERFCELAPDMQEKHAIYGPVCLYRNFDMERLIECVGMTQTLVYSSPFGNVKAMAYKKT